MACSDQITAQQLENMSLDAVTAAEIASSRVGGELGGALIDSSTTRLGDTFSTLRGQLVKLGYEVPVSYVSGIVFTVDDGSKTIEEGGIIYAPLISALPFTTSGTFVGDDDSRFRIESQDNLEPRVLQNEMDIASNTSIINSLDKTLQSLRVDISSVATGSSLITFDDTIPQKSEGFQVASISITPESSTSNLKIKAKFYTTSTNASLMTAAIFRGAENSAISAATVYEAQPNTPTEISLDFNVPSGSTSTETYSVRIGNANSGTTTVNGVGGARRLGGIMNSFMEITETQ